ncbi:MAG TPA: methyltransferase domain-containing protein [Thermoplasmata archaeon]|nr:methyltransferase domain-containing protein [Thermoplasmata archaeon]
MAFARMERGAWTDPGVARAYEELFRPMVEGAIEPLLDAVQVRAGVQLLDLACGPGRVGARAAQRGAEVTYLDFSRPMLERARHRNPAGRFLGASAERLPLRSGSVGAAVCNFGLLHLPEPDRALREVARVLAPGGWCAWSVWAADAEAMQIVPATLRDLHLTPRLPEGPPFFRFGDPTEFSRSLAEAGLQSTTARASHWIAQLSGPDQFIRMFEDGSARTRASLQALSEAERERVRAAIRERLEKYRVRDHLDLPTGAVIGVGQRPV